MRQEISDEQFVAWSRGVSGETYDVKVLSNLISTLQERDLIGIDVGGATGHFADAVISECSMGKSVRFVNVEPGSLAQNSHVDNPSISIAPVVWGGFEGVPGSFDFIVFRTVLHHMLGGGLGECDDVQRAALIKAKRLLKRSGFIFVVENVYNSLFVPDLTGKLIFEITSVEALGALTRRLGANTGGEGVRFRDDRGWRALFERVGLGVEAVFVNPTWGVRMPLWQRLPLFCKERRQYSYVLKVCG